MSSDPLHHLAFPTNELPEIPMLPVLTATPTPYAGCCLALSAPLLSWLRDSLPPPPDLVLSIGSGYGLLEALLLHPPYSLNVAGVEVHPTPNTYLPKDRHHCVLGSRFVDPAARDAKAWLFVYPRRAGLVQDYLSSAMVAVNLIVWIGPHADWVDYEKVLSGAWTVNVQSASVMGGRACDLIAVANKELQR